MFSVCPHLWGGGGVPRPCPHREGGVGPGPDQGGTSARGVPLLVGTLPQVTDGVFDMLQSVCLLHSRRYPTLGTPPPPVRPCIHAGGLSC